MSAPDVVWVNVQDVAQRPAVGVSYATADAATSAAIRGVTISTVRYVRADEGDEVIPDDLADDLRDISFEWFGQSTPALHRLHNLLRGGEA